MAETQDDHHARDEAVGRKKIIRAVTNAAHWMVAGMDIGTNAPEFDSIGFENVELQEGVSAPQATCGLQADLRQRQ